MAYSKEGEKPKASIDETIRTPSAFSSLSPIQYEWVESLIQKFNFQCDTEEYRNGFEGDLARYLGELLQDKLIDYKINQKKAPTNNESKSLMDGIVSHSNELIYLMGRLTDSHKFKMYLEGGFGHEDMDKLRLDLQSIAEEAYFVGANVPEQKVGRKASAEARNLLIVGLCEIYEMLTAHWSAGKKKNRRGFLKECFPKLCNDFETENTIKEGEKMYFKLRGGK